MSDLNAAYDLYVLDLKAESNALYTALRSYATSLAHRLGCSDPDNASSGAVTRLWQRLAKFEGKSSFGTWAHAVMRNCLIDEMRKESTRLNYWGEPEDKINGEVTVGLDDVEELGLNEEDTHILSVFTSYQDYEDTAAALGFTVSELKYRLKKIKLQVTGV
jgi:DNA-directed RNA polymerase specialized sigma24 family protein